MKISLVLSTYNGEKYIVEQLDSLRAQTRAFDEVLIGDDCSTDATPKIVQDYIDEHNLGDTWRFVRNKKNKGWKRNFHDLILKASGDVIFLCDQDDIWLPEKVAEMTRVMELHPEVDVLSCAVEPFYEKGAQRLSMPPTAAGLHADSIVPQLIDDKAIYIRRPGCSYCVRRTFVNQTMQFWHEDWPHDTILWTLAEVKGSLFLYDRVLMRFRRHASNASSRVETTRNGRLKDIAYQAEKVTLMESFGESSGFLTPKKSVVLEGFRAWLEARHRFLETRSPSAFHAVWRGRRRYLTRRGILVDIILAVFPKTRL